MSSALFGRGTFLQTGHRERQDQLDKQLTELRSFAVAATQEIRTLKEKVLLLEAAIVGNAQTPQLAAPQKSAGPSAESSAPALVVDAVPESSQ